MKSNIEKACPSPASSTFVSTSVYLALISIYLDLLLDGSDIFGKLSYETVEY